MELLLILQQVHRVLYKNPVVVPYIVDDCLKNGMETDFERYLVHHEMATRRWAPDLLRTLEYMGRIVKTTDVSPDNMAAFEDKEKPPPKRFRPNHIAVRESAAAAAENLTYDADLKRLETQHVMPSVLWTLTKVRGEIESTVMGKMATVLASHEDRDAYPSKCRLSLAREHEKKMWQAQTQFLLDMKAKRNDGKGQTHNDEISPESADPDFAFVPW
jgi:hypothetical protein